MFHLFFSDLALGGSALQQSYFFKIGTSTLYKLIPEVCTIIYEKLREKVIKFSKNTNDWTTITDNFYSLWNFPNCLGAVDAKEFEIMSPTK